MVYCSLLKRTTTSLSSCSATVEIHTKHTRFFQKDSCHDIPYWCCWWLLFLCWRRRIFHIIRFFSCHL